MARINGGIIPNWRRAYRRYRSDDDRRKIRALSPIFYLYKIVHSTIFMASMIVLGTSFLIFFITLGFLWLIGSNIIANVIASLPPPPAGWEGISQLNENNIRLIMTIIPSILILFASIKMLTNAASRGADWYHGIAQILPEPTEPHCINPQTVRWKLGILIHCDISRVHWNYIYSGVNCRRMGFVRARIRWTNYLHHTTWFCW